MGGYAHGLPGPHLAVWGDIVQVIEMISQLGLPLNCIKGWSTASGIMASSIGIPVIFLDITPKDSMFQYKNELLDMKATIVNNIIH